MKYNKNLIFWLILFLNINLFAQQSNKTSIAVVRLDFQGISEYKAAKITDCLRNELFKTNKYQVMEWENMDRVLREKGYKQPPRTPGKWLLSAGRILHVERIIGGGIGNMGGTYILSIHVIDVVTGRILRSFTKDFSGEFNDVIIDLIPGIVQLIVEQEYSDFLYGNSPSKPKNKKPSMSLRDSQKRLIVKEIKEMIKANGFCDAGWNKKANGISHDYEEFTFVGDRVVIDYATGLMWQQAGSSEYMSYYNTEEWIEELNREGFAGFHDWRLPTLEEAMSLVEPNMKRGKMYIDNIFSRDQSWIWTSDLGKYKYQAWVVVFFRGYCDRSAFSRLRYVRAVRSFKTSDNQ